MRATASSVVLLHTTCNIDIFVEWRKMQLSSESLRDSGNLFSSI